MNLHRSLHHIVLRVLALVMFIQPIMCAHAALHNVKLDCVHHVPSIMSTNEWQELQLDWLADTLDKTDTSMGSWAFRKMLYPVADRAEIERRQAMVKALVDNDELYACVRSYLQTIQQQESFTIETMEHTDEYTGITNVYAIQGGLLSYWNPAQYKEADKLFAKIAQLYWRAGFVPQREQLNTNAVSLECSMAFEMGRTASNVIYLVGVNGLLEGFAEWMLTPQNNATFDPLHAFYTGLLQPVRDINPFPSEIGRTYDPQSGLSFKEALMRGTMGDRFISFKKQFNSCSFINLRSLGRLMHKLPLLGRWFTHEGAYKVLNNAVPDDLGPVRSAVGTTLAGCGSVFYSYWRLGMLWEMIKGTYRYWMILMKSLRQLHTHLVHISTGMQSIQYLNAVVQSHEAFKHSCIADHFNQSLKHPSKHLKRLLTVLRSNTFSSTTQSGIMYSRGRTLLAHRLLEKSKRELVPMLRAIGELDAITAMATNIRDCSGSDKRYAWVQFVESSQAYIDLKQCWMPVLDQAVANDISFGDEEPTKLVITGPNGGGKSTVLKALGHAVVLAQSWGVVPAQSARMTMFNAIRTCLHPNESLQSGLSTFMAEKGRVDEICSFLNQNRQAGFKVMVLLDEPFKGTVDAEAAERIFNLGKEIAKLPESIICIATHVKKPIYLAEETGVFTNRHVVITPQSDGSYIREFRLADGPAWWWFEDKQKRAHFIDWLGQETIRVKQHARDTACHH